MRGAGIQRTCYDTLRKVRFRNSFSFTTAGKGERNTDDGPGQRWGRKEYFSVGPVSRTAGTGLAQAVNWNRPSGRHMVVSYAS